MTHDDIMFSLYAVKSRDGKFFRNKGYGGYGDSWVDKITKARIYSNPGPAKSQITFWSKPEFSKKYGIPDLVQINVGSVEIVNQNQRVKKSIETKERRAKVKKVEMLKKKVNEQSKLLQEALKAL